MRDLLPKSAAYAAPAFALAIPTVPLYVLLPSFYVENVGLSFGAVGVAFFILRLFDMITDPAIGWLADRYNSKILMSFGGLLAAPSLYFLLTPTLSSQGAGVAWLMFWGAGLFLGWSFIQIPYLAGLVSLCPTYQQRTKFSAMREGFGVVGILGASLLLFFTAELERTTQFQLLAAATVGLGAIGLSICLTSLAWPSTKSVDRAKQPQSAWGLIRQNKLFLRLVGSWFLNSFANALAAVSFPLFVSKILQLPETAEAQFLFWYFLAAILGLPVWNKLSHRYEKHLLWCGAMGIACAIFAAAFWLGAGHQTAFLLICIGTGFCLGADLSLPPAIQADLADWHHYRFKHDQTASLFSLWSMSSKFALAAAALVAFGLLELAGLAEETAASLLLLSLIYTLFPIVLKISSVWLMRAFPIGAAQHKAIKRRLSFHQI